MISFFFLVLFTFAPNHPQKVFEGRDFKYAMTFSQDFLILIKHCTFTAVHSSIGGAILSSTVLQIQKSEFIACLSGEFGGAISTSQPFSILSTKFYKCISTTGSSIFQRLNPLIKLPFCPCSSSYDLSSSIESTSSNNYALKFDHQNVSYTQSNLSLSKGHNFSGIQCDSCNSNFSFSIFSNSSSNINCGIHFAYDSHSLYIDRSIFLFLSRPIYPGTGGSSIFIEKNPSSSALSECLFIKTSDTGPSVWVVDGEPLQAINCCTDGTKGSEDIEQDHVIKIGYFYSVVCDFKWSYTEETRGWMKNFEIKCYIGRIFVSLFSFSLCGIFYFNSHCLKKVRKNF